MYLCHPSQSVQGQTKRQQGSGHTKEGKIRNPMSGSRKEENTQDTQDYKTTNKKLTTLKSHRSHRSSTHDDTGGAALYPPRPRNPPLYPRFANSRPLIYPPRGATGGLRYSWRHPPRPRGPSESSSSLLLASRRVLPSG